MKNAFAIAASALVALAGSASAATLSGTMGFIPFGNPGTFVSATTLSQATSFTWGGPVHLINNPGTATYLGLPNIFNSASLAAVTVTSPVTLPGGNFAAPLNVFYPSLFSTSFGGANIVFSSTSQSFSSSGPNSLNITFLGTVVDTNNVFSGISNAAMTMNFTILGGKQVNYSTSFATTGLIPSPAAAALLGLGGLAAARRRR
jgi:hypothetical protein